MLILPNPSLEHDYTRMNNNTVVGHVFLSQENYFFTEKLRKQNVIILRHENTFRMTNSYWTWLNSKLFCILFFVIVFEHFISVGLIPYFVKLENMAAKKVSNATFHLNCYHHLRQGPLLRFESETLYLRPVAGSRFRRIHLDKRIFKQDVAKWQYEIENYLLRLLQGNYCTFYIYKAEQ